MYAVRKKKFFYAFVVDIIICYKYFLSFIASSFPPLNAYHDLYNCRTSCQIEDLNTLVWLCMNGLNLQF